MSHATISGGFRQIQRHDGIFEALHHAYRGELKFHYSPEQNLLCVSWTH